MTRSDWLYIGVKLLGLYFLCIGGMAVVGLVFAAIMSITYQRAPSAQALAMMTLYSQPLMQFVLGGILVRWTPVCLRLIGDPTSHQVTGV